MLTHYLFIYLKKEKWSPPTEIVVVLTQESTYFFSKPEQVSSVVKTKIFLHDNYKRLFVTALRFKLHTSS